VVYATDVRSRDGKQVAVVRHVGNTYYLEVGPTDGGPRHTIYRSAYITTDVFWASSHLIAFGADDEVNTVDVRTRHVRRIVAWATSFNISPDGRWIAWTKAGSPHTSDTVGVVPSTGGECLIVPRPNNRSDSLAFFKPGVKRLFFLREPFSAATGQVPSGRTINVPMSSLRRAPASAC
jgi:tricorn protease-like protein